MEPFHCSFTAKQSVCSRRILPAEAYTQMPGYCSRASGSMEITGLKVGLIVAVTVMIAVMIHAFPRHVVHGTVIALAEAFAEIPLRFAALYGWVLVHLMIVGIGMAMLAEVVPCRFHAFVIAALLCVAITIWSLVPTIPVPISILILGSSPGNSRSGHRLPIMRAGFQCASRSHTECKKRGCKPL